MQYASRDKKWKLSSSLHRKKRKHFLPLTVKLKGLFRIWKRVRNKGYLTWENRGYHDNCVYTFMTLVGPTNLVISFTWSHLFNLKPKRNWNFNNVEQMKFFYFHSIIQNFRACPESSKRALFVKFYLEMP